MNTETLRLFYKPKNIKFLFIGESPPTSGDFFYKKSNMTIYTRKTFEKVYGISFSDHISFLDFFRDAGCYLDDLSHISVDDKPSVERERILKDSISGLASRIKTYKPKVIVIALRRIENYVKEAINIANIACPIYTLPFAGNGHQNKYIQELAIILKKHMR
jgi:hypothetical protein